MRPRAEVIADVAKCLAGEKAITQKTIEEAQDKLILLVAEYLLDIRDILADRAAKQ